MNQMIVTKWLFFTIASCDAAEPSSQDAATPVMQGIIDLHHDIFFFLILILVFVLWVLVRALWHFHYRRNPIPQRIVHGTTIEIIWTIFPSIILMFIAIPSFAFFYFDVALCQPPVEEGPEVSSGGSLGALMRSPEAPSLDWDELLQGRSLNPDQGTGRVGSHTPGDTVSGSAVDGGAAPASASTPPNEYLLTFLRWPLDAGSYYSYLSWAHLFPEHVQPCHWGAAPWLPEYRVAHELTVSRDIQETLGCICCPKASCPLWKPGGWGVLHHHPLPGDISPSQYAYFRQHFPQPKYYVGLR